MEWIKKQLKTRSGTMVLLLICFALLVLSNAGVIESIYTDYRSKKDSIEIVGYNQTLNEVKYVAGENSHKYDHISEVFRDHQKDDIRFRDRLDVKFESIDTKQDAIIRQLERLIGALHGQGIMVAESD